MTTSTTQTPNPAYTEILKLATMCREANLNTELKESFDGYIVILYHNEQRIADAIQHGGSLGHEFNLLEEMGIMSSDDVQGCVTAEEVLKAWKEKLASIQKIEQNKRERKQKEEKIISHNSPILALDVQRLRASLRCAQAIQQEAREHRIKGHWEVAQADLLIAAYHGRTTTAVYCPRYLHEDFIKYMAQHGITGTSASDNRNLIIVEL